MDTNFILAIIAVIIIIQTILHISFSHQSPSSNSSILWFYRDGCGYCTKMEGEWSKFIKIAPSTLDIQKIDIRKNEQMVKDFNVQGVPHIVLIMGSQRIVYNGDRSAEDLLKFATSLNIDN